jgi:hypothetical protein
VALIRSLTMPTERPPLVGEVSANFCRQGCRVVSAADPYVRNLDFSTPEPLPYFSSSSSIVLMRLTPFQTHYFSENLVALGVERGPLEL